MSGDKISKYNNYPYLFEIPSEKEIKQAGKLYVNLRIYDTATSHKTLAAFIKQQWSVFQFFLKNQKRRTKSEKSPSRNRDILYLDALPTNDLYSLVGINKSNHRYYRHDLIAKILQLKGGNPGEQVRKFLLRHKKKLRDM